MFLDRRSGPRKLSMRLFAGREQREHQDVTTMSQMDSRRYDSKNLFNPRTEIMDSELSRRADSIQQRILQLRDSL
jgi:hypothetical protein